MLIPTGLQKICTGSSMSVSSGWVRPLWLSPTIVDRPGGAHVLSGVLESSGPWRTSR